MLRDGFVETAYKRPQTMAPVAQVYRMSSEVGLAKGNEPHFHPDTVEICFVKRGNLDWWIDTTAYEIHSGDVVVMTPGIPHGSIDSTLQPCEYFSVHLDPNELPLAVQSVIDQPRFGGHYASQGEGGDLVQRIFHEHERADELSAVACRSYCELLVTSLARHPSRKAQGVPGSLVRRAQQALYDGGDGYRSVDEVARLLGISNVWLTELFQRETGESPGKWLQSRKIREAKRLLVTGSKSVTEIAVSLGFTSTQYFATAFRRQTGMTASEYRDLRNRTWRAGAEVAVQSAPI